MTVNTSAIPAAITYLVGAARTALPNALVFDGPMLTPDSEAAFDRVTIGWSGDDGDTSAVDVDQDWSALNRGVSRDEHFRIMCSVLHWDGNNDIPTVRTAAFALLAAFEKLMRGYAPNGVGDVTLGGAVLFARIAVGSVDYPSTSNGTACHITFQVACRARLTGS